MMDLAKYYEGVPIMQEDKSGKSVALLNLLHHKHTVRYVCGFSLQQHELNYAIWDREGMEFICTGHCKSNPDVKISEVLIAITKQLSDKYLDINFVIETE